MRGAKVPAHFFWVHRADRIGSVTTLPTSREGNLRKIVPAIAAAALLASAATPAAAGGRYHHRHHDDVDAGDVVAGAVVAVGVAALVSSLGEAGRAKQDAAVDRCSAEAEGRTGGQVSEILHVAKRKGYYTVEGALAGEGDSPRDTFTCTIRHNTVYSFQSSVGEA